MSEYTLEQAIDKIKELEKQNRFLQGELNKYNEKSPARAYYVALKLLNQQIDFLDKFDFENEIKSNPKEDKIYDRAMDVYEKMTSNASKINSLRIELNLSGDERKDTRSARPFSPESVADEVGELAGKRY